MVETAYFKSKITSDKFKPDTYVTAYPKWQFAYAYDLSFTKETHSRVARLWYLDQKYWFLFDGVIRRERYDCFLRYTQPLTKRGKLRYDRGIDYFQYYSDHIFKWIYVSPELFNTYYEEDPEEKNIYPLPLVYKSKPPIFAVCDTYTREDYDITFSPEDYGLDEDSHITQIRLSHRYYPENKKIDVFPESQNWDVVGYGYDDEGYEVPIIEGVYITYEPEWFVDNYYVYYNCRPLKIIVPKLIFEDTISTEPPTFKYWLNIKQSKKCISFKKHYIRPTSRLRHFTIFLEDKFSFEMCDIYRKEEWDFRITDYCNMTYAPNHEFFYRVGNGFYADYRQKTILSLRQDYAKTTYFAKVNVGCFFQSSPIVDKVYLPFFTPRVEQKSHRAKVICMRWT